MIGEEEHADIFYLSNVASGQKLKKLLSSNKFCLKSLCICANSGYPVNHQCLVSACPLHGSVEGGWGELLFQRSSLFLIRNDILIF
jgi:hypothetical protein